MNLSIKKAQKKEIEQLKHILNELRKKNKILLAYLYGSSATKNIHARSDIDLALYINVPENESFDIIEQIVMSIDRDVEILRLDDEDESPFIIQQALKGVALVEPDTETLYKLFDRVLHETETIRFRRKIKDESKGE
ncbi:MULTISPECIES: nucleotidyltransferase domain-containing protein [Thermodesulfovibrio]|uniref:Nucleotidyltransferase domain, putative n=2 Tax=Thermodesulfovibrio yellowstonii TaxID=28262 RepID=B5YIP5_THEYD|nr:MULTISPECIES: nucleotidyltransferase domain-containing protein [Thermodesulfovibrio]ACI20548.1 nucleotidyltransferase domain, putative [Thermodesulfovibrio yellowstonii DSM 11347]MBC7190635.1 nucleotidyltransferase domain-containing protein [Candidatus Aerophobetes bacterium]GLI54282.1 nucleotidyltransferase [Thermodesulfovibrio islandicus]